MYKKAKSVELVPPAQTRKRNALFEELVEGLTEALEHAQGTLRPGTRMTSFALRSVEEDDGKTARREMTLEPMTEKDFFDATKAVFAEHADAMERLKHK